MKGMRMRNLKNEAIKIAEMAGKEVDSSTLYPILLGEGNDFKNIHTASDRLRDEGYSLGSMCRDEPIAFAKGERYIAKWRNIGYEDYPKMDGVLMSSDFRNGEVTIVYFK